MGADVNHEQTEPSMKNVLPLLLLVAGAVNAPAAFAEPTTPPVSVVSVRPYIPGGSTQPGVVFLAVDQVTVCSTSVYQIDLSSAAGKMAAALATVASTSGQKIQVEVSNTAPCNGVYSIVQSIYLLKP